MDFIIAYSENIGWKVVFRIFRSELQRILRRWGRSLSFFSIAAITKRVTTLRRKR